MSSSKKNVDNPLDPDGEQTDQPESHIAVSSREMSNVSGSTKNAQRMSSSSERQIKFERAQRCLENAAHVSKRIKEHRKATAELLGRPFDGDDGGDGASDMTSTASERTGYSVATDISSTSVLSVQDALNIPGISESLANTLKQKEILMERIKQYKEISKRPLTKSSLVSRRESTVETKNTGAKQKDINDTFHLQSKIKEKENALTIMQVKMKAMETSLMDLQEKLSEKDQIIEAKTKATSLMSDSLNKKEKDSLLEETRQQMTKMQENFIVLESEWKAEQQSLIKDIATKNEKIKNLEEANTILENSRFDISIANTKLTEELELKNNKVLEIQEELHKLSNNKTFKLSQETSEKLEKEKGSIEIANMEELTKKIELLEKINCQIRQTNKELENKLANLESKTLSSSSPSKKASPVPTRKGGGRNMAAKTKSPWSKLSSESLPQETDKKVNKNEITKLEMIIQALNKDILDKDLAISQRDDLVADLTNTISEKEALLNSFKNLKNNNTKNVDVGIVTEFVCEESAVSKNTDHNIEAIKILEEKLKSAQDQIIALNEERELSNKNSIKVKSNQKLKLKQMQKTIEHFSNISDSNAEIIKLNEELHKITQKVAELEEEKGNLQLHLVDYDSGRLTESDTYKKMLEMENLAESRLKAISILETQKFDLVQELHELQQRNVEMEDKLADMSQFQNEQVCSEMKSVQLEEQIDNLTASKKELELVIENLKLDKEHLNGSIKHLQGEKEELSQKLDHYIKKNIELADKLEKLSAEKVSSAESIEIVESLTTQEKLELEQYNQGMIDSKMESNQFKETSSNERNDIEKLVQESAELNSKIELFTQERQEVMEKLNKLSVENKNLHDTMQQSNLQISTLQNEIKIMNNEKQELEKLNQYFNQEIEKLNQERLEIMKESVASTKPSVLEDIVEAVSQDASHDDKVGEKGSKGAKSVKQLTKEILKLKNTIKEREAEIGDCQMKILSLEEQQQKQNELLQSNLDYENKLKKLLEENIHLKDELSNIKQSKEFDNQIIQFKENNEMLVKEIKKIQDEYSATLNIRDLRIKEMEGLLCDYEKQIQNYANALQIKDKELTENINQVFKLNEVSQKLKSTIEMLEEEKARDQSAEIVKSLNKQINVYQKKLVECEDKLRALEEEILQTQSTKSALENKNKSLEVELKTLQDKNMEKQNLINSLQLQQDKHAEEMMRVNQKSKERDEEIHEIKLQLRKESIEYEKIRNKLYDSETIIQNYSQDLSDVKDIKDKLNQITMERDEIKEHYIVIETKNKELLEKLKKFAGNLKKKTGMCIELENKFNEAQKELEIKNQEIDKLALQIQGLPDIQDKLKYAEEELNSILSEKSALEQQLSQEIINLQNVNTTLQEKLQDYNFKFNDTNSALSSELQKTLEENNTLHTQIDTLNKKIIEYEVERKNNLHLQDEILQKQQQINTLLNDIENLNQIFNQKQFGLDAKVQERELYIESLESEISKYKNRICRLEDSISIMEGRRHSLERKADQLDTQLQEKQKAYTEYSSQEDELINRLAVLMDHDRVIEKQLYEIENENKELQCKIQNVHEENQKLRKSLSETVEQCNILKEKASKADMAENDSINYLTKIRELETELKKLNHELQRMERNSKETVSSLESEFSEQIESALKEKKLSSEKYEKMNEYVLQLQQNHQEDQSNIQNLSLNLEELTRFNQELSEKITTEKVALPDYTGQYISEINKLNSIINNKNEDIMDVSDKARSSQISFETNLAHLNEQLQHASTEIAKLLAENNSLKDINNQLQDELRLKLKQFEELKCKNIVSFEMSIPKTEGMIISSTIEAVNVEPKQQESNVASIESQIVTDVEATSQAKLKVSDYFQQQPAGVQETAIRPKKAYLCYGSSEDLQDKNIMHGIDPFNSDEGWGLGETDAEEVTMPGLSQLNEQIIILQKQNDVLKNDFAAANAKYLKALKKLKELKASNDMLSNELKISKQLSQSSFLDCAIENELKNHIQDLESKMNELNMELAKEKKEKEHIKKQNEVFYNTNDRLQEMKEKMDNELELWKFKFKEANDKIESLQWEVDSKTPEHKSSKGPDTNYDTLKNEMIKLEKENDELQSLVDQLSTEIKELNSHHARQQCEISSLTEKLLQQQSLSSEWDSMNIRVLELQKDNSNLRKEKELIAEDLKKTNISYKEIVLQYDRLKTDFDDVQKTNVINSKNMSERCNVLEQDNFSLKILLDEANSEKLKLTSQIAEYKSKLDLTDQQMSANVSETSDSLISAEKYKILEDQLEQLKLDLHDTKNLIYQMENEKLESEKSIRAFEEQNKELNDKIQKLNLENDQLLSTVTELRSSIASAMDQRGFEIAEIWKQHLAQRENEFHNMEQDLQIQLNAAESKYEQLLDNFQSSNQEDTSKLIMINALQSKVQDKEEQLVNIHKKYAETMNELDMLRSEIQDEKVMIDNKMLEQQEEYEVKIKKIIAEHQEVVKQHNKKIDLLKIELDSNKDIISHLSSNTEIEEYSRVKNEMESTILELTNQLRAKDSELYQKCYEYTIASTQRNAEFETIRQQMVEYEKKIEDLNFEKESELAILRLKMHENTDYFEKVTRDHETEKAALTEDLNARILECSQLNRQIAELNKTIEEQSIKKTEMQTALENQEIEIVTLKDEIENLQPSLRSVSGINEKHVTFAPDTKPGLDESAASADNTFKELFDAVPRAELDLALYMLHQRDVRCEELTMELTHLLDERDTLQLRLSDSLRSFEDLKSKCKASGFELPRTSQEKVSELPTVSAERETHFVDTHRARSSSSSSDPDGTKPALQAKLSELRSVKQSRDVTLRQDSEQRQLDMRLLQRDVANLPPEAVEQLQQAHHTLSRDSQSAPTVLLNWLRGKSTPKVVQNM